MFWGCAITHLARKSGKEGSDWLNADIMHVLAKVCAEQPGIVPNTTRYQATAPSQRLPLVKRPRRGRRTLLEPDAAFIELFYHLDASMIIMATVAELARRLGVGCSAQERGEPPT